MRPFAGRGGRRRLLASVFHLAGLPSCNLLRPGLLPPAVSVHGMVRNHKGKEVVVGEDPAKWIALPRQPPPSPSPRERYPPTASWTVGRCIPTTSLGRGHAHRRTQAWPWPPTPCGVTAGKQPAVDRDWESGLAPPERSSPSCGAPPWRRRRPWRLRAW